jgi:cytochrome c
MPLTCSSIAAFLASCTFAVSSALAAEDSERGKALFEQCAACHSLESGKNEVGPTLHGLFGRPSASEDFTYSPAMRRANIVWTAELLDAYLANPQGGVFRANRMPYSGMPDAQARMDLITYLKQAAR